MQAASDEFGGSAYQWATKTEDRTRLWKASRRLLRRAGIQAGHDQFRHRCLRPDFGLADCILETKVDVEERSDGAHTRTCRRR